MLIGFNLGVQASGIPVTFNTFRKKYVAPNDSPFFFMMMIVNGVVQCIYSVLTDQSVIFKSQACGALFGLVYLYVFLSYSTRQHKLRTLAYAKRIGLGFVAFTLIVLIMYVFKGKHYAFAQLFGCLCLVTSILLMASPLSVMRAVIKDKTSIYLQKSTVIATFLSASAWLIYGLSRNDWFVWFPNLCGLIAAMFQIFLLYTFPAHDKKEKYDDAFNSDLNFI